MSQTDPIFGEPVIKDPNFVIEKYVTGLSLPTSIDFIGKDLLVLEKNSGTVRLINNNGILLDDPVLDVEVTQLGDSGLLGITSVDSTVYLYFTESKLKDGGEPQGNHIYKYEWQNQKLINPILLHTLPVHKSLTHNSGPMVTGSDGTIYAVIGDTNKRGILQNLKGYSGDSGVIIKVDTDGSTLKPSESENRWDYYYAMGIRNSFGLAIDPFTGNLWDTENGHLDYDEINLVHEKFNSGWRKIMGPFNSSQHEEIPEFKGFSYSDPEFSWERTVAPTGLTFMDSIWFENYTDSIFVGDFVMGTLYNIKLNSERTGFIFQNPELQDLVANGGDSLNEIVFGTGFNGITDLEVGPDGFLYVVSIIDGIIYRILPSEEVLTKFSPKKQSDFGLNPKDILCAKHYERLLKITEDKVVCVNPSSVSPLTERGWKIFSDEKFVQSSSTNLKNCEIDFLKSKDLSNCDLSFKDISNYDLSNFNLTNTNLSGSILKNTNLTGAKLINTTLIYADLSNANLSNSLIQESDLKYTRFWNADLSYSNIVKSEFRGASFQEAIISHAVIKNSNFHMSFLPFSDLSNSQLIKTRFTSSDLSNSNLSGSDFSGINLNNSNLFNSNLSNVNLSGSKLSGANLTKTNLTGANLNGANLENTILNECLGNSVCQ